MGKKKRITAILLTAAMILSMQSFPAFADNETAASEEEQSEISTITNIMNTGNRDNAYSAYYEKYRDDKFPKKEIVIEAKDATAGKDSGGEDPLYEITDYSGQEDCLVWTNNRGTLTYDFEVSDPGNFRLSLYYYTIS